MNSEVNRQGKFHFYGDWPDNVLSDVSEHLKAFEWLLPPWCHLCAVTWNSRENEAIARCRLEYDYRRFCLTFGPQWMDEDEREKRGTVVHELVHSHNLLIAEFARREIERLLPEGKSLKYRGAILDGLKLRVEQSTCDLTFCLLQKL